MDLSADHILVVFLLTTLAGLATGIGGFIAFFMKRTDTKTLTFALGLSGGVMVYISLVELLGEAQHRLIEFEGHTAGSWIAIASFFGGIAVAALIDYLVPEDENPHEARGPEDIHGQASGEFSSSRIKRSGILFALAIGIHNFPEGIATFAAGLDSLTLGTSIALAVAVHNIPEGIAVAVPLYYGTGSRKRPSFIPFSPVWLNRWAQPSPCSSCSTSSHLPYLRFSLPPSRALWFSSPLTNCCPWRNAGGTITFPSWASSPECC